MNNDQIRKEMVLRNREDDYPPVRRFTYRELRKDRDHLRLLAIFYYVVSPLIAVFGLLPGFYVALGAVMLSGAMGAAAKGPPPAVGIVFMVIGSGIILLAEVFAVCVFIAGRSLATQKRYVFCFVVAVLLCLNGIPIMILGVFSIVVLARETVKELFAHGDSAFPPDEDYD